MSTLSQDPTHRLLGLLDEAATLLERVDVDHWATWLRSDIARIEAGDRRGVEHLLSAYGGMGSINDLIITPVNGHDVSHREGHAATEELRRMLSEIWTIATQLR